MDDYLRRVERRAQSGDYEAQRCWKLTLARAGFVDPDVEDLHAPLTEAEETQQDYDEMWWHGNTSRKCGLWGRREFWDCDFRPALFKAHHDWGHRGWGEQNAKRQTIRTHRNGSRKNYRLRRNAR